MRACVKYWLNKNKWFLAAALAAAGAAVFVGGGSIPAAAVYAILLEICAVRFISPQKSGDKKANGAEKRKSENAVAEFDSGNALKTVKQLNVAGNIFFNAYILLISFFAVAFAGIFALSTVIGDALGFNLQILPSALASHQTAYSIMFLYECAFLLVILALCALTKLVNADNIVKRAMIFISTVYCAVLLYVCYLLILLLAQLSKSEMKIHMILAVAGGAALIMAVGFYLLVIFKSKKKFCDRFAAKE